MVKYIYKMEENNCNKNITMCLNRSGKKHI